jgi:hypothetical protein
MTVIIIVLLSNILEKILVCIKDGGYRHA